MSARNADIPQRLSEAEQACKLRLIARLSAGELEGWISALRADARAGFPGERAALAARARELGVTL